MVNKLTNLLLSQNWEVKWEENFEHLFFLSVRDSTLFREDMLLAEKKINANHYIIDIGAYGRNKVIKLLFVKNQEWDTPLQIFKIFTFEELLFRIKELLKEYDSYNYIEES